MENGNKSFTDRLVLSNDYWRFCIKLTYVQGGDCFLLVEIGTQTVDVRVTTRIRLLVEKLQKLKSPKLVMNPNVGCELSCAQAVGIY